MSAHLPEIDQLHAADGAPSAPAAAHLAECADCRARVDEARRFRAQASRAYGAVASDAVSDSLERRMSEIDRRTLEAESRAAPRMGRLFALPAVRAGLAAAALLAIGVTLVLSSGDAVVVRDAGVFRDRPAGVRDPASPVDSARSGEAYRLRFRPEKDGFVAVFNLDGAGKPHLFFPFGTEEGSLERFGVVEPLPAGTVAEIPPAGWDPYKLDVTPGEERFFVAASERPFGDARLVSLLREIAGAPDAERTEEAVRRRLERALGPVVTLRLRHDP